MTKRRLKDFLLNKNDERKFFAPRTWEFWRGIIIYFFVFSLVGHWMEIPYCWLMHSLFGIVEDTYDVWTDPFYVPYWVYGIGTVALTFIMMPLKMHIINRSKTIWGAVVKFFIVAVVLCAVLETVLGLLINQPDAAGEYPFWDNSVLPFNILGQGWLVNDIALGLVSLVYVWVLFPFCQKALRIIGDEAANIVLLFVLVLFAFICAGHYGPMLWTWIVEGVAA